MSTSDRLEGRPLRYKLSSMPMHFNYLDGDEIAESGVLNRYQRHSEMLWICRLLQIALK